MGVIIFEKNQIDLDVTGITITASDSTVGVEVGQDLVDLIRSRKNDSGWGTGGSTDAGNTTLLIESENEMRLTDLLLVRHNFKNYTIQYWDGAAFVNFPTTIAVTNNTVGTTHHNFAETFTTKVKLIVTATQDVNDDKYLAQFLLLNRMGAFVNEPMVKKPKQERGRKVRKMLSGRSNVTRTSGAFSCTLNFPALNHVADWAIIEAMYDSFDGFLVWLCGGDTSDFFTDVQGWRLEDIYLCQCTNDLDTEWNNGRFAHGQKIEINLVESRV